MSSKLTRPLPAQCALLGRMTYDPDTGIVTRSDGAVVGWDRGNGYLNLRFEGAIYMLHRVIWKMQHGVDPECIDHVNGDVKDNRLENLRAVSHSDNKRNQRLHANNKTGHSGVYDIGGGKWSAGIHDNGKSTSLGRFNSFAEAVKAREDAERRLGYHENHGSARPRTNIAA